jgi:hypothetical protein
MRYNDKSTAERLAFASFWLGCVAVSLFIWWVVL